MLCLIFLSAILVVLGQGKDSCTPKYYTVNTFGTEKSFSFSCYGVGSDCKVYYTPPGIGCTGDSLLLIGSVPESETKVLTSNVDLELGGGFCSDNQIGVYYVDEATNYITAHLPRETDGGTKFHLLLTSFRRLQNGKICILSALSLPANVSIDRDGVVELLSIDPYNFTSYQFEYSSDGLVETEVKINSDNPIIVTCSGGDRVPRRSVTLQPISSEPLFVAISNSSFVSMVILNCSTNELISDHYSKVDIGLSTENGFDCNAYPASNLDSRFVFEVYEDCVMYLSPTVDNICVSIGIQQRGTSLVAVGIPESKFSTRFVNYPEVDSINLFSFSETTCTSFEDGSHKETLSLVKVEGEVAGRVSIANWSETFSQFSYTKCKKSTLLFTHNGDHRYPFLSGYQSKELWQPFLNDPKCSSAKPLISRIGWVPLFAGIYIFSSRLV